MLKNQRGITLVELMIVVAIIGILAALGSIAYGKYIMGAKIEKLRQYGMEVSSGQERFRSRNNVYWNPTNAPGTYTANKDGFKNLLDFSKNVPAEIEITVAAWSGEDGSACGICAGIPHDLDNAGYAVKVSHDMIASSTAETELYITNSTENPIILNEGE